MAAVLADLEGCWARRDDAPPFEDTARDEVTELWACNGLPVDPLGLCAHHREALARRVPR